MTGRRLTRRQTLALGLGGIVLPSPFIGGGKAMADSTPDTVVYVSNAGSKDVYVLAMNRDSGELTMLDKVPVPGTDKPSPASMPMAVSPITGFSTPRCAAICFRPRALRSTARVAD
jgi:6-phosphogluconolactonase